MGLIGVIRCYYEVGFLVLMIMEMEVKTCYSSRSRTMTFLHVNLCKQWFNRSSNVVL